MKKPFVISVSGLSGSGKTTAANALEARLDNCAKLSFDDYGESVYLDRDLSSRAEESNYDEWHTEPISSDVERLISEPLDYIIMDYPFGYGNRLVGRYIDLAVYIDVPLDVALARRIIRDYTSREESADVADVEDVSLAGLDKELRLYLACSRSTYARMPETRIPLSDLVVDGTKTPEEIADEIISYMNTREHYDALIDENNDPILDPLPLQAYMDKWDGDIFLEELRLSPEKSVLEIGVGTGRLAVRICGKCGHFTGIDISPKTIGRAKENLRSYENAALICGNFLTYPFSESFDTIYSSLTFMHIQNKRAAVQRAASLLNPGGRFILSIDKNRKKEIDYGDRKITVYPDTAEETAALITDTGLVIERQHETEFAVIITATKEY